MWPIVPPGGVSWKQPCSSTSVPLHDDDDDQYNKKYKLNNARTEWCTGTMVQKLMFHYLYINNGYRDCSDSGGVVVMMLVVTVMIVIICCCCCCCYCCCYSYDPTTRHYYYYYFQFCLTNTLFWRSSWDLGWVPEDFPKHLWGFLMHDLYRPDAFPLTLSQTLKTLQG